MLKLPRQTIDTFQAASTFFDLLNMSIWAPVDPELAAKSKYSKYHAVRIAKAIKAGEDPNASNPVSQDPAPKSPLSGLEDASSSTGIYRPPTVESAPESKQPSRPSSVVQASPFPPPTAPYEHVASPGQASVASRSASVGGGYFPDVPTFTSDTAQPTAPTADATDLTLPDAPGMDSAADFYNPPPQAPAPAPAPAPMPAPVARAAPPPTIPQAAPLPPVQALPPGSYRTDDDSMTLASKHAKWAISALNFEDVNTAVKELRLALQSLGAQ